jgi:galactofuranose transport system permease protein
MVMSQRMKHFFGNNAFLLTTIAIFILVYFLGGQLYPAMRKTQVFFNLFINTASLLIVAIGMTFVIITKGIDLSVAGMIALTSAASASLLDKGASPVVVMPLMLVMGIAFGFTLGCIIHFLKVEPFIVTLMGLFFARGMAYVITLEALPIQDVSFFGVDEGAYSSSCQGICVYSLTGRSGVVIGGHLFVLLHPFWAYSLCNR